MTNDREKLSAAWKERFELLDKIDGNYFRRKNELTSSEQRSLVFRIWAFVFFVFYYLAKGMWEKAILIYIAYSLLGILFDVVGLPVFLLMLLGGVTCATLATTDYYNHIENNERVWPILSGAIPQSFRTPPVLVIAAIVSMGVNLGLGFGLIGSSKLPSCGDSEATNLVEEIFNESTDYGAVDIDLIREIERNEQTGAYVCAAQLTDNEGDLWDADYTIRSGPGNLNNTLRCSQSA